MDKSPKGGKTRNKVLERKNTPGPSQMQNKVNKINGTYYTPYDKTGTLN